MRGELAERAAMRYRRLANAVRPGYALIVGAAPVGDEERAWLVDFVSGRGQPALVVAADAGGQRALELGLEPSVLLGDLDSLHPDVLERYRREGIPVITYPVEKDATDVELALDYCRGRGLGHAVLLGALGGRLDHTLANIILVAGRLPAGGTARLLGDGQQLVVLRADRSAGSRWCVRGAPGDVVSLIPLSPRVTGITLRGFHWALRGATLAWGQTLGVSNRLKGQKGYVFVRSGVLLLVHRLRQSGRE